jgi:calcium/calmodulin-dependent protein kinase I
MSALTEKYELREELGRGAFSIVKLAVEKSTGIHYAVKMIKKDSVGQDFNRLQTEMEILKKVQHPNIIALKEIIDTKNCLFIVTELVTGGELFDKIVELGSYSEKDAALLVSKIVSAIAYLHSLGIVHRDLKPENLLLKDETTVSEVKLADFGLSKIVSQQVIMQTACGTPGYVAPEILQARGYDKEVDMWSIGVITYILLCGFPPFYNEKLQLLFEQIMRADYDFPVDYWSEISENAKDFIRKLLVVEPSKRLNSEQALQHPWLTGNVPATVLSIHNDKQQQYTLIKKQQSKVLGANLTFSTG